MKKSTGLLLLIIVNIFALAGEDADALSASMLSPSIQVSMRAIKDSVGSGEAVVQKAGLKSRAASAVNGDYSYKTRTVDEVDFFTLSDGTTTFEVSQQGNILSSLKYRLKSGREVELLHTPENDTAVTQRNYAEEGIPLWGIPVLFPFGNRIRQGAEGTIPVHWPYGKDTNTPIHGMVYSQKWKVEDVRVTEKGVSVTSSFDSSTDTDFLREFGYVKIELTYAVSNGRIAIKVRVFNLDDKDISFGLGFHPFFKVSNRAESIVVIASADKVWELDNELIPTGELLAVDGEYAKIKNGEPLGEVEFDDVFHLDTRAPEAVVSSPQDGWRLSITADSEFSNWVVASPGWMKDALLVEPMTAATNAHNMKHLPEANLTTLPKGKYFEVNLSMRIEEYFQEREIEDFTGTVLVVDAIRESI